MLKTCFSCDSDKTFTYKPKNKPNYYEQWYSHNGKWYCNNCNNKLFKNPKWHPITNTQDIYFKGRTIFLGFNPRKGICSLCGAVVGIDCKRTHIHHIKYDNSNPLKHIVELCARCHGKETKFQSISYTR